MGNQLLTISDITQRGLPILANQLIVGDKFNRSYDREFGQKGRKIGGTANVRLPARYVGTFGPALNVEAVTENYMPVSVLYQFHIDIQFTTAQLLLDADDFDRRYMEPAMAAIANRFDSDCAFYALQNLANRFGTPGTPPAAFLPFAQSRAVLVNEGMPRGELPVSILTPLAQASMADAFKGQFNPQADISELWETGMIATKTAGADWFEDPVIASYTTGAAPGAAVLAGVVSSSGGSALLTSGWAQNGFINVSGLTASTAAFNVGDTIQIAGIYPANPQTRTRYGNTLKQFTVLAPAGYAQTIGPAVPGSPQLASATLTAGTFTPNSSGGTYTASGSGTLQVLIGDAIITSGQFQNCVATSAFTGTPAITLNGGAASGTTSVENLFLHRDAMCAVTVDLPVPRMSVEGERATDEELGLSVRCLTGYLLNTDVEATRFDIAYGVAPLYRSLGARVSG